MIWEPSVWLLLLFPALIALYFLKLKRREMVVSSTILWKRSLEDYRANAPFRRLRSSLLLILQLLVLAGIVASAWKPRIPGTVSIGRDIVVLLDVSASASAREEGGTRLDLEKRAALRLVEALRPEKRETQVISKLTPDSAGAGRAGEPPEVLLELVETETLRPGDRMTLLSFASRTVALGAPTDDPTVLAERIRRVRATALPTDLEQALRVVASLSSTLSEPDVYVLGDGCYGDMAELPEEVKRLPLHLIGCGTRRDNMAITQADVRTSYEEEPRTEVFALVENFGESDGALVVSLELEDRLVDARQINVPRSGARSVVFDVSSLGCGTARVAFESDDALTLDNEAWVQIPSPKEVRVLLVGQPNPWIELALESAAGLRYERTSLARYVQGLDPSGSDDAGPVSTWDVLLFDRKSPPSLPDLPAIYIGCVPELPPGVGSPKKVVAPRLAEWDRPHPVNRFLGFADLYVEEAFVFPPSERYRSLVDADEGSLIGTWTYSGSTGREVQAVIVGFDLMASNWPLVDYSYPLFFPNAVRWLASGEGTESVRWRTGETLVYHQIQTEDSAGWTVATFRSPSGRELPAAMESSGSIALNDPEETGVYELIAGGLPRAIFPVSLLSARESRLEPSETIDFGDYSLTVAGGSIDVAKDLWKWFALVAIGLLLWEWTVYQRRSG